MPKKPQQPSQVSPELDEMVCDLIGYMLDELADGGDPGVITCVEDAEGTRVEASFTDDGEEACLEAARTRIAQNASGMAKEKLGPIARYAIGYVGGVQLEDGVADAVLVSFYERGLADEEGVPTGYSAYVLFEGAGEGDGFAWADPAPAGAEEPLI